MKNRTKVVLVILGVVAFLYLWIYTVLTPFIRGVVIDAETKEPVADAWVMVTASIGTRTVAGDVGGTFIISRPHLRTGKDGVFYVFPKLFPTIPTPFSFGNVKKRLEATVRVMDGRRAEVNLSKDWWKRVLLVTTSVMANVKRTDRETRSELRTLYGYCTDGSYFPIYRTGVEVCDGWELDYTINRHEVHLEAINQPRSIRDKIEYSGTLRVLSNLYKRKGEYNKALELLKRARDFDSNEDISFVTNDYDFRIRELQEKMGLK